MIDVETQVDKATLDALSKAVGRLQEETGRSAEQSVIFAALKVSESGRSASKPGKRRRDSVDNPQWKQARWAKGRKRRGFQLSAQDEALLADVNNLSPFFILAYKQGESKPILLPSYDKQDPRRQIERHGLARQVWGVMVGKMGAMQPGAKMSAGGRDYRVSKYAERYGDTAGAHVVRLVNKLPYLERAYPGITQRAVSRGTAALTGQMDRRIKRAVARANAGGKS